MLIAWILIVWLSWPLGPGNLSAFGGETVKPLPPAVVVAEIQTDLLQNQPLLNADVLEAPEQALIYRRQCWSGLEAGDYDRAIEACGKALRLDPTNFEVVLTWGVALYRSGHYQDALAGFEHCLRIDASDYRGFYNRGLVHLALHRFPEAVNDFDQALKLAPDTALKADIYNDRGLAKLMTVQLEAAIADFNRAVEVNAKDTRALFNRGCACHQSGQIEAAMTDFNQVIQMDPADTYAYVRRGLLRHDLGDHWGAMQDLYQAADYARQHQKSGLHHHILTLINKLQAPRASFG